MSYRGSWWGAHGLITQKTSTFVAPLNPSVVVDKSTQEYSEDSFANSDTSVYSGKDWLKTESLVRGIAVDKRCKNTRKVLRSLHHLSIQNQLLQDEIVGLKSALKQKKKHSKKNFNLPLQQLQEYHGGAVFWSSSKRQEAEHLYDVVQRLEMEEKLKKINDKEERNAAKALQLSQKGKGKVSQASQARNHSKRVKIGDVGDAPPPAPPTSPPHKITTRGRSVKLPAKFK